MFLIQAIQMGLASFAFLAMAQKMVNPLSNGFVARIGTASANEMQRNGAELKERGPLAHVESLIDMR